MPDETSHVNETVRSESPESCVLPKRRKRSDPTDQLVGLATEYFKKPEGEEDVLAKSWAYKLKRLVGNQKLFAEKLINDILFEAEMGNLTREGVRHQMSQQLSPSPTASPSSQLGYQVYTLPRHNPKSIQVSLLPSKSSHNATNKQPPKKISYNIASEFVSTGCVKETRERLHHQTPQQWSPSPSPSPSSQLGDQVYNRQQHNSKDIQISLLPQASTHNATHMQPPQKISYNDASEFFPAFTSL